MNRRVAQPRAVSSLANQRSQLTEAGQYDLVESILAYLRTVELRAPREREGEVAYTRSDLLPAVQMVLDRSGIRGLVLGGDHTGINRPVSFVGETYTPDIIVQHREQPILAIEVKLLRSGGRTGATSTAIGQAGIYGLERFPYSAVFLIDTVNKSRSLRARPPQQQDDKHLAVIIRRKRRQQLLEGVLLRV